METMETIKTIATDMLLNSVPIIKAGTVVEQVKKKADIEVTAL